MMNLRPPLNAGLLLIALCGAACAEKPTAAQDWDATFVALGETIVAENCVACHGENGKGYIGPALNGSAHAWHHPDSLLVSFIRDGIAGTQMPAQRDNLTDEEIDAVISYMKSWWSPQQRQKQQSGQR